MTNPARGTVLAEEVRPVSSFFARFRGLMGVAALPAGHGLLLDGDNSIHTCFMRFPIDVVFLDRDRRVVHQVSVMRPWRVSRIVWRAKGILELPAGTLEQTGTAIGDQLVVETPELRPG